MTDAGTRRDGDCTGQAVLRTSVAVAVQRDSSREYSLQRIIQPNKVSMCACVHACVCVCVYA